jgi:hypothetical protein
LPDRAWFRQTRRALTATAPGHEQGWRCDLVTWSEHNTEAFAGLHNMGRRIVLIFDEASGIADKVWEVALGALTDADTELIWLAFGNPTQNTGAFRECFGKHRNLWRTAQIDARDGGRRQHAVSGRTGGRLWRGQRRGARARARAVSVEQHDAVHSADLAEAARRAGAARPAHRSGDLRRRLRALWR